MKQNGNHTSKKGKGKANLFSLLLIAIGLIICFSLLSYRYGALFFSQSSLYVAVLLLGFYAGLLLQIVIHESGHLVFGLISGYRFVSFRIGSTILYRQNGKYRLARYSLAGTGGQCLLSPPDLRDGKMPVTLYNLGGVLFNLIFSVLFFTLTYVSIPLWLKALLLGAAVSGAIMTLTNGIPLHTATVNNDGSNLFHLKKDPQACKALWMQLRVNERQTLGERLKDMPDEWFAVPEAPNPGNSMISAQLVFCCNRLMDCQKLADANLEMKELLERDTSMPGIYRSILLTDRIYCALIQGNDADGIIEKWNGVELNGFKRAMKNYPSLIRTEYAYALLFLKDKEKAAHQKERFQKVAKQYPYKGDVESEWELILLADVVAQKK